MSTFQQYWTAKYQELGDFGDLLKHAENVLGYYLPPATWKGHQGVKFIINLGAGNGDHLRVRKDFFQAIGIDLSVKLKYSSDYFLAVLLNYCKKKKLDPDILLGSSWVNTPKDGNYVLGVTLMLFFALGKKSFLTDAVVGAMRLVETSKYQQTAIEKPVDEVSSTLNNQFKRYTKTKTLPVKEGNVVEEVFADKYAKEMSALKDAVEIYRAAREELAGKKSKKNAVKARHGNKLARGFAEDLGVEDVLDRAEEQMENESAIDLFERSEDEQGFDHDSEEELMQQEEKGTNLQFLVNANSTRELVHGINSLTLVELMENACKALKNAIKRKEMEKTIAQLKIEEAEKVRARLLELEREKAELERAGE